MWDFLRSRPICPVDEDHQKWVDGRFRWLQEQLGEQRPREVRVVLPTPEFFPDTYNGGLKDAQAILVRVAGYMNVDPARFKLFIYSESRLQGMDRENGSAGLYLHEGGKDPNGKTLAAIGIESSQLGDPLSLVATLAHEIGHEILIGQGRITPDQPDHEPLTDLLTVFLGMGIFGGNATIRDRGWSSGGWAGWQTRRLGYLDQRTFGYALARFAWTRGESSPSWIKSVRPDVRAPLKAGLRFLSGR